MSLLSWFSRKPSSVPPAPAVPSGLLNADATVPMNSGRSSRPVAPDAQQVSRKHERMERRELLYAVIRDVMVRAGVLSASYKFKVLSLDPQGQQFLVMVDLARDCAGQTGRWNDIEVLIAQKAKASHDILVTAVYWRISEHVAAGGPQTPGAGSQESAAHKPVAQAPAVAMNPGAGPRFTVAKAPPGIALADSAAAPGSAPVTRATPPRPPSIFDPIQADEVAAFRLAVARAASPAPSGPAPKAAPVRSGPLLAPRQDSPDFADTELTEDEPGHRAGPDLGSTQYGELR